MTFLLHASATFVHLNKYRRRVRESPLDRADFQPYPSKDKRKHYGIIEKEENDERNYNRSVQ